MLVLILHFLYAAGELQSVIFYYKNAELNITPIEERILNMSSSVMVAKCIQSHRESDFVFLSFGW